MFIYIYDLVSLNNTSFDSRISKIYPDQMEFKRKNPQNLSASYVDLLTRIKKNAFHTSLNDKREF